MDMDVPPFTCEILRVLINRHDWGGSPASKEVVITCAAVPSDGIGEAKETFEQLRTSDAYPFVENHGPGRVLLDNSEFGSLAEFLFHCCEWEKWKIDQKLKHYEGLSDHDF